MNESIVFLEALLLILLRDKAQINVFLSQLISLYNLIWLIFFFLLSVWFRTKSYLLFNHSCLFKDTNSLYSFYSNTLKLQRVNM